MWRVINRTSYMPWVSWNKFLLVASSEHVVGASKPICQSNLKDEDCSASSRKPQDKGTGNWLIYRKVWKGSNWEIKAPSTLIRFQTKKELFCSGYGYRPHYNAENNHGKRSHSKTLSRVERFENDAFRKLYFLAWTEKTMLSENGNVAKINTTRRHRLKTD